MVAFIGLLAGLFLGAAAVLGVRWIVAWTDQHNPAGSSRRARDIDLPRLGSFVAVLTATGALFWMIHLLMTLPGVP